MTGSFRSAARLRVPTARRSWSARSADRFDLRRSDDGRRIVLDNRGPSDLAAVARYGYHVQVVVDGGTVRSEGYPTVNQHPPVGG